ncbi:MAG: nucleotidyltransferase domain-containing protein [Desulfurococcales archaeon]|nr:nucleotidyltransferase domain-containing protein [Desulfurococcales archaeon]
MVSGSVDNVVDSILQACGEDNVRAVIVYGSVARGEARTTSDVDVLVLVDKPCNPVLPPPYTIMVTTLEEWIRVRGEFQMEVFRDGLILYARNIGFRKLLNKRPWVLIRYSGREPAIRQCIKNAVAKLVKKMPIEKIAPAVIMAPYGIVSNRVLGAILSCNGDVKTLLIAYREIDVYYAVCPYCGYTVAGYERYVKREMKKHLLTMHRDRLKEIINRLVTSKKGVPGGNINGVAGWLTSYLINKE